MTRSVKRGVVFVLVGLLLALVLVIPVNASENEIVLLEDCKLHHLYSEYICINNDTWKIDYAFYECTDQFGQKYTKSEELRRGIYIKGECPYFAP